MPKIFERVYEAFCILGLICAPVFNGAFGALPRGVLQSACIVLMLLWFAQAAFTGRSVVFPAGGWLLVVFAAFVMVQTLPMPHAGAGIEGIASLKTVSIYPYATLLELAGAVAFFGVFIVTLNVFDRRSQYERLILALIVVVFCLSLYGVMRSVAVPGDRHSFATFANRNHYASFTIMGAFMGIGYCLAVENKYKKMLVGFAAATISVSIFLSLSRAGSISFVAGLILLGVVRLVSGKRMQRGTGVLIAAIAGTVVVLLLLANLGPLKERFLETAHGMAGRLRLYRDAMAIAKEHPLCGIGFGNFTNIFPAYTTFASALTYTHLHNDHLQFFVETGAIGVALAGGFFIWLGADLLRGLSRRRDPFVVNLVPAGLCGLVAVILHGSFDFGFHIPAVSWLFWLLLGLLYRIVFTHFRDTPS